MDGNKNQKELQKVAHKVYLKELIRADVVEMANSKNCIRKIRNL